MSLEERKFEREYLNRIEVEEMKSLNKRMLEDVYSVWPMKPGTPKPSEVFTEKDDYPRHMACIINGAPGVGKDTFVEYVAAAMFRGKEDVGVDYRKDIVYNLSTISAVSEMVHVLEKRLLRGVTSEDMLNQLLASDTPISYYPYSGDFHYELKKIFSDEHKTYKTDRYRRLLSRIKNVLVEEFDGPNVDVMADFLRSIASDNALLRPPMVFIHCREHKEIEKLKEEILTVGCYCVTLHITRNLGHSSGPVDVGIYSNDSDKDGASDSYHYDFVIDNSGSLEELRLEAESFWYVMNMARTQCYY